MHVLSGVMNLHEDIKGINTNREECLEGTPTLRSQGGQDEEVKESENSNLLSLSRCICIILPRPIILLFVTFTQIDKHKKTANLYGRT